MNEILPGIFTWPWFAERFGYNFNGHLIEDAGGNLVIDPVEPSQAALDEIVRRGAARILITNRNHFRAGARLREATGARLHIHPADAPFLRERDVPVDEELVPGQRVGPLTVVGAAGKSPGEVALHWPERRILFVGDACVGNPPGKLALLSPKVIDDLGTLKSSLAALAGLDFDALLLGDGASILAGARAALQELVERSA